MTRSPLLVLLALFLAIGCALPARAHGDSLSSLRILLRDDSVHASLTLAFRDLSDWVPPGPADYPAAVAAEMRQHADELIQLKFDDAIIPPRSFTVSTATTGQVVIDWIYPATPANTESIEVQSRHLSNLPIGHHQAFSAEDERSTRGKHLAQALLASETLGREEPLAIFDVPKVSRPAASTPSPASASLDVKPPSTALLSSWYFRGLLISAALFLCWRLVSLRSTLKPAEPLAASDQPGRTS